jgi:serine/threonine protein kinase
VVGHYRLDKEIARGGMGEVYRATDLGLKREVALKLLRGDAATQAKRVERFAREAEAASALNHPGIVSVFDAGSAIVDGSPVFYLAMEIVDGPSLATLLAAERLTLKRALTLAAGIAEALAAAHASGILHRDLKPSNILVAGDGDGHPKIVDFGLAKHASQASADRSLPTDTVTTAGEVVGTAGYMSPEQARGDPVSAASDQFAFGCVLYELLTGVRAFDGGSFAETLSSVLRDEPAPVESLAPDVPMPLRWIVRRCLAKSPAQRYASTTDLGRDLRMLGESYSDLVTGDHLPRPARTTRGAAVAALSALGVAAVAVAWTRPTSTKTALEFRPLTFRSGFVARALFTPRSNGILLAASWDGQPLRMYQTIVESVGFDRPLESPVQFPLAYSQDGAQVLTLLGVARDSNILRGTLAWWPALGGAARPLVDDVGWSDWAPRSQKLAVVRDSGTARILELRDADGRVLKALDSAPGAITWVRFSPDEKQIAFVRMPSAYGTKGEVWTVDIATGAARARTPLLSQCRGLDWHSPTGDIWFTASRENPWSTSLYRLGADGRLDDVHSFPGGFHLQAIDTTASHWLFTSYDDEADIVVSVPPLAPERRRWFGWSVAADVSPDSRSYLFFDGGAGEKTWGMWIRPLAGGDAFRIGDGSSGRFSPDGKWVVAAGDGTDEPAQLTLLPVGAGEPRAITSGPASYSSPSFDGAEAVLAIRQQGASTEVVRVPTTGGPAVVLAIEDCEAPLASPGGATIACVGGRGRELRSHPRSGGARTLARLDSGRIIDARWHRDGHALFAMTTDRRLLTVDADRATIVKSEDLAYGSAGPYDRLIGGAVDDVGRARVYSLTRSSGILFIGTPQAEEE